MKRYLILMALLATGSSAANAQAPAEDPKREISIHGPAGTKIGPDDKVTPAKLITRVNPIYPPLARQTRISGTVKIHVIIDKEGAVQQMQVVSGHPLLVQSALDAVRQWKYQPTLLNGEPVEVDTAIDVIFALNNPEQQAPPSAKGQVASAIDPVLRADVMALLKENNATEATEGVMRTMFEGMRPTMLKSFGGLENREKIVDSYEEKLITLMKTDEFREGVVAAYAKYFDDGDVKNLIAFYDTPTGKKFNQVMPKFSADLIAVGQRLAEAKLPDILRELCKEYPELDGKLPPCSAAQPNKKSQLQSPLRNANAPGAAAAY